MADLIPLEYDKLQVIRKHLASKGQWYVDYYAIRYAEMSGDANLLKKLESCFQNDPYLMRVLHNALGRTEEASSLYAPPEEVKTALHMHLQKNEIVDWDDVSAPLNHYPFELLRTLSNQNNLQSIRICISNHTRELMDILECADIVKELPFDRLTSLRQTATAFRSAAIARALLGQDFFQAISDIRSAEAIYDDISSINGLLVTLLSEAVVLMFGNQRNLARAKEKIESAEKIARISKDSHSMEKCHTIWNLYMKFDIR